MIAVPVGTGRVGVNDRVQALWSFALAATAVGIIMGLLAWVAASLAVALGLNHLLLLIATAFASGYGVSELLRLDWPLPQRHWQVPQRWGASGRPLYASAFGAILSTGFLTFIPYAGYYVLVLLAVALNDWHWSVATMTLFAWARVAPIVAFSERLRASRPPEQLARAAEYSEQVVRVSARLWLPRGALLVATAVATARALFG